jgi:hypothetical protein
MATLNGITISSTRELSNTKDLISCSGSTGYKCICCGSVLKQDSIPTHLTDITQYTRYFYCVNKECTRFRILVIPFD